MKRKYLKGIAIITFVLIALLPTSCTEEILNQEPTVDLGSSAFWQTEDDAFSALMGAYSATRGVFFEDYLFDGMGEYQRSRGNASAFPAYSGNKFKIGRAHV